MAKHVQREKLDKVVASTKQDMKDMRDDVAAVVAKLDEMFAQAGKTTRPRACKRSQALTTHVPIMLERVVT